MAILLSFSPHSNPNPRYKSLPRFKPTIVCNSTKRDLVLKTTAISLTLALSFSQDLLASPATNVASKSILSSISSTKSWFQYFGSGFAIRIPPGFDDVEGPEDYSAGMSMYGDKVKPKTYAARFSSPDGSEVVSVVIRPSNQIKITFLEAKDIADFGSLKQVAKLFVPGGSKVYSARTIKIKETDGIRNYYFYEFGIEDQHFALVAAANSGKVYVSGAAAPESKWDEDGVRLRSAAISLSILFMLSELQKMNTGALPYANMILEESLNAYFSCESKDLVFNLEKVSRESDNMWRDYHLNRI